MGIDDKGGCNNESSETIEIVELAEIGENQEVEVIAENQEQEVADEVEKFGAAQEYTDTHETNKLNDLEIETRQNSKGHTYNKKSKIMK